MVLKKSEYQNQFKSSQLVKNQSVYLENLTFRNRCRDREFIHTPICWQAQETEEVLSSEDEEINENFNCNNVTSKAETKNIEPQYQSLAEILDESKAKSLVFKQHKSVDVISQDLQEVPDIAKISLEGKDDDHNPEQKTVSEICHDDVDESEKSKYSSHKKKVCGKATENENTAKSANHKKLRARSNLRRKGSAKQNQQPTHDNASKASGLKESDDCCNIHEVPSLPIGTRPRRPDRQMRIPSAKYKPVSQERPPFVAYGAGDKEDTFTTHRTHNVRSTVDVYGAALKAKIRREEEKKRQIERQRKMAQSTNDLLDKLASATPRDMFDWRSEYQKQFHGYEPIVYERSSSSRAVISHSTPIRAVHRGGGLIVHVD